MKKLLSTAIATLGLAASAHAHQIWIEQPEGQSAVIRFGEFGDNLRETSPGLLDNFGKPTATMISDKGEQSANAAKSADGFTLPFKAGEGDTIVAEDAAFPLRTFKQGDKTITSWYRPAARYVADFAEQAPKLALDVVPAGQPGTFKVFFDGKPLPSAKVAIVVQSGWAQETRSDDQGVVSFNLPWKGSYVLEAAHIDRKPGERPGKDSPEKYDGINYVTTLHVSQPDGLEPIPAGPQAKPNK
ncbi:DUF4198 domain-containing protein [Bordetella sp. BOR01]|uniref:DUF4198 domain-containing protein n=1 Tax=Bordetella sp. BOR01 TaxID=2854779 RepID=UPI001C4441A9|nr:DUF4198 domain-containing protein [Bordetella sp. BOR01]MBV7486274.1 DUF4198 domain-containing protein [Bordetella sp. BOR01]